jgi:hypothetical protein
MVRSASCASPDDASHRRANHEATNPAAAILRDARKRAPQDEDFFLGALPLGRFAPGLFLTAVFAAFFAAGFLTTAFFVTPFAFRVFGRFFRAARCAAASAVLAHTLNSSESSNNRAGNSQYEFTVTILARV